jgi:hypothetical protein
LRNIHRTVQYTEESRNAKEWIQRIAADNVTLQHIFQKPWTAICCRVTDANGYVEIRTRDLISITNSHWMTDSVMFSTLRLLARTKGNVIIADCFLMELLLLDPKNAEQFPIVFSENEDESQDPLILIPFNRHKIHWTGL